MAATQKSDGQQGAGIRLLYELYLRLFGNQRAYDGAGMVIVSRALILLVVLLGLSAVAQAETSVLSPAQRKLVAQSIDKLKLVQERQMATQWSDAKKVAEFICRPAALKSLRLRLKGVDRVFLGSDDPKSLSLAGNTALTGMGHARMGGGWREFRFNCEMNPTTAQVKRFDTLLSQFNSIDVGRRQLTRRAIW